MDSISLANLRMLQFIATKLGSLRDEVVFLGGSTTALFITDKAAPDVRYTLDVDCIVDVITSGDYRQIEKKLEIQGFKRDVFSGVLCRWQYENVVLDVMPTDKKILGFGNRWYKAAIQHAKNHVIADNLTIKVVTAPYFLATKLEAFAGRGNNDYLASHDFEDIISVIDGRPELVDDVYQADQALKEYLVQSFNRLLQERKFHDALPGHMNYYGALSNGRIDLLLETIAKITQYKSGSGR
ncbi:MAG: hypothetical protein WCR72_16215 [Bacteroidota bacterium]